MFAMLEVWKFGYQIQVVA
uniref:Uncharacterized protein n=1 Tax=Rhizophora mucronata TaxID=61149 RepID=A0A2P2N348_RHIMU